MQRRLHIRLGYAMLWGCLALLLSGCIFRRDELPKRPIKEGPTPTIAAVFSAEQAALVPTPTLVATPTPLTVARQTGTPPTPQPTLSAEAAIPCFKYTNLPAAAETAALITAADAPPSPVTELPLADRYDAVDGNLSEISIFTDQLQSGWVLTHSEGVQYAVGVNRYARNGSPGLFVSPLTDCGKFLINLEPDGQVAYPRKQVIGIRFWLSGGADLIDPEDLAVAVTGSNAYPYWRADDQSVVVDGRSTVEMPLFSERWLWSAGIHSMIPPNTWVELIFWFEDDWFEPQFRYVTGIYFRNQHGYTQPFLIDDVRLIVTDAPEP